MYNADINAIFGTVSEADSRVIRHNFILMSHAVNAVCDVKNDDVTLLYLCYVI